MKNFSLLYEKERSNHSRIPQTRLVFLPDHVTLLARFGGEPSPVKSTVTKAVAEFRRTHADTWNVQKDSFTEEQLEVAFNL